jgi:hypothetical protein
VQLDRRSRELLGAARIGMLAFSAGGGRPPLVNPAAFYYAAGSIWITTSRFATKLQLARRDPRAGFLVDTGGRSLLLQGLLEVYDLRSLNGQLRAALAGPGFYWSMTRYTLKNAPFVGGYLLDLAHIPSEWWPQNRVVMRLRANRARELVHTAPPLARPAKLPLAPAGVVRALARASSGYVCWINRGLPFMAPALWSASGGRVWAAFPAGEPSSPRGPAALVVESHHRYRATRMVGACARGTLEVDAAALAPMTRRYGVDAGELGAGLRLDVDRVTWWRGFHVDTVARRRRVASDRAEAAGSRRRDADLASRRVAPD